MDGQEMFPAEMRKKIMKIFNLKNA